MVKALCLGCNGFAVGSGSGNSLDRQGGRPDVEHAVPVHLVGVGVRVVVLGLKSGEQVRGLRSLVLVPFWPCAAAC